MDRRGRGTFWNPVGRFETIAREKSDAQVEDAEPVARTRLHRDQSRTVISWNQSPDIPFDRSINPYRGCEHGCIYCFARPTHEFLGMSPGLDFETNIHVKLDAAALLAREMDVKSYVCAPLAIGTNTDAYQPVERRLQLMRKILKVLIDRRHPVGMVTKSALILRDVDLLAQLAELGLVHVNFSITTLDAGLASVMEPRASVPSARLHAIAKLKEAGIPCGVMVAPVIPGLTDEELESILESAHAAGADSATYILVRLPHGVKELFADWLTKRRPLRKDRVLHFIREMRGGNLTDSRFMSRGTGEGIHAELLRRRFVVARKRLGFGQPTPLRTDLFRSGAAAAQPGLFDS